MAIPASHIVSVQPRVISGGSSDLEMNGLLLSKNDLIPASSMVLEFPSAKSVGDYFGTASVEFRAATVYFAGYQNKAGAPRSLFIARRIDAPAPACLAGAPSTGTLAELKQVTDGGLSLTIDGTACDVSGLSLASASSLSAVAQLLQSALDATLSGVRCVYSSQTRAFAVESPSTGATSTVTFAQAPASGANLAALLGLDRDSGALLSAGSDALDVPGQMDAVRARCENWVSFTTAWEAEADEMLQWAAWADANYGWLYVPWTTNAATPLAGLKSDPASKLKEAGYDHTAVVYGGLPYALFIMGATASISWMRANGTITLAFKKQPGLAAQVNDQLAAAALEEKNCNYFGNFATRNADFVFLYPGCLSASDYGFIDAYINSVWLNNRVQVALMDGLSRTGRIPYNERGYTLVRSWLMEPVTAGLNNAAIEPGVELSESQRTELANEAGLDISAELQTQGYYIQIKDPDASVRARRESPVVSLWYTYGGSVQKIDIASTAVL